MISAEFDEELSNINMLKITLIRVIPKWDGQTIKERVPCHWRHASRGKLSLGDSDIMGWGRE